MTQNFEIRPILPAGAPFFVLMSLCSESYRTLTTFLGSFCGRDFVSPVTLSLDQSVQQAACRGGFQAESLSSAGHRGDSSSPVGQAFESPGSEFLGTPGNK